MWCPPRAFAQTGEDTDAGGLTDADATAADVEDAPSPGCVEPCAELDAMSLANEGARYATGDGVPQDLERAAGLFRRACDAGNARACSNLGVIYHKGEGGIPRDDAHAAALFEEACEGGYVPACYNLGLLYERSGDSVVRAVELYREACRRGHRPACDKVRPSSQTDPAASQPASPASESEKPCSTRYSQRHDKACWTPRSGVLSGIYAGLDFGVLTASPAPKKRLSLDAGVTIALRLGVALWDQLLFNASIGGMFFVSSQDSCTYSDSTNCTEGIDTTPSIVHAGMFNLDTGYQYRMRPSSIISITPGVLVGYLTAWQDLKRECADCASVPPTHMNPSGVHLAAFARLTFGRRGKVGIFLRNRWFVTGGLLNETALGVEVGLP